MRVIILTLLATVLALNISAQERLKSGLIQVTGFPTNNGNGTFTINGTFNDPTGLTFASDIVPGMLVNKGNDFFIVESVSVNGAIVELVVQDTYNVGFISGGTFSIGEVTQNLQLPGLAPSGDSNPSLTTPTDQASKFNLILQRIDRAFEDLTFIPLRGDTIFQANHGLDNGSIISQASNNGNYFEANTNSPDSFPIGLVVEVLHPDTFVFDHSGWVYDLPLSLQPGVDYFLQSDGSLANTPDQDAAIFILRTSSVRSGKAYFDIPEAVTQSAETSDLTVTVSNGLNDQDATSNVDVELGGNLDKPTTISGDGNQFRIINSSGPQGTGISSLPGQLDLFVRDVGTQEIDFSLLPGSLIIEADNSAGTDVASVTVGTGNISLTYSNGGTVQGSIQIQPGGIRFVGLPTYASDAAADADSNLPQNGLYLVTGDRSIHIKP